MSRARSPRKPQPNRPDAPRPAVRRWLLPMLIVGVFAGGSVLAWRKLAPTLALDENYRVTPEKVEITPPPEWVRSDVKSPALRDAGFDDRVSLLEPDLVERIARAFSLQPWVAEVVRVQKSYPARITVELRYRRPVCMVEVPGGLYAVDIEGVVLPSQDFSPLEARDYPRLSGITSTPLGPVGTAWGDPRVVGGARIGAALLPHWKGLGLARIVPLDGAGGSSLEAIEYEIHSRSGTRLVWGHAPGVDQPHGEPTADDKLNVLLAYVDQHGPLDGPTAPPLLDLRRTGATAVRSASSPSPANANR